MARYFVLLGLVGLIAAVAVACDQSGPSPNSTVPAGAADVPDQESASPSQEPTETPIPEPTPVPPSASFSVDVDSGSAPLTIKFNNTSQGPATSMQWHFGDGMTSTEESPSHRFTAAGTYNVELTVVGPGGTDKHVILALITVEPGPPVSLEVSPPDMTLAVQESTRFTAVARDEFGNVVPDALEWALNGEGGSITDDGLFIADTKTGIFADVVSVSLQTDSGELVAAASVTVESGPIAAVILSPNEVNLEIGDTQAFTVEVLDEFGNRITDPLISFRSTADAGIINSEGSSTAGTRAGIFAEAVEVEVVKGTARGSGVSKITIEPAPLASIKVEPSPALLRRGETVDLIANGYDQYGNAIPELEFLWKVSPGLVVDRAGRVTAGPAITGPNLVSWWPGENSAEDVAGTNDGSRRGGASFAPGVVGQGFNFDGINDYILVDDADDLNITGDVTVNLWAKRIWAKGTGFSARPVMIAKGGGIIGGRNVPTVFLLRFGGPDPATRGNHIKARFETRSDGSTVILKGPEVIDTFFHHYAYVRTGNRHELFSDGMLVAKDTIWDFPGDTAGLPLVIGADRTDLHPTGFGAKFTGVIDEVQVFDRGLSNTEIRNIYDATKLNSQLGVTVRASYKGSQQSVLVMVAVRN